MVDVVSRLSSLGEAVSQCNAQGNGATAAQVQQWSQQLDAVLRSARSNSQSQEDPIEGTLPFSITSTRSPSISWKRPSARTSIAKRGTESNVTVATSVPGVLSGALHIILEAVAYQVRAARAVCYVVQNQQAYAIGTVGTGLPAVRKVTSDEFWTHHVLNSGIGVNVHQSVAIDTASSLAKASAKNMMCFPLKSLSGTQRYGVVQVFDKDAGKTAFDAQDEAALAAALPLISYIIEYYPSTPLRWRFDERILRKVKPFAVPPEPVRASAIVSGDPKQQQDSDQHKRLLVFRTAQSRRAFVSLLKTCSQGLEQCSEGVVSAETGCDLADIESYITRLEECWQHGVALNKECLHERELALERTAALRDELSRRSKEVRTTQALCREREALCDEYRLSYEGILNDVNSVILGSAVTGNPTFLSPRPPRTR